MVATEELGVDVVEAKEVIAIYQNDSEIAGSAELDNGVVVIQSMQNAKNKVTIPIKKRSRKVTLDDLKYNLQKNLPKIVYIDSNGHVTLSTGDKPRIGRVLPSGQGSQDLSLGMSSYLQIASDRSATFVSQLDRQNYIDDRMSGSSVAKSLPTRYAEQRSGDLSYDAQEIQIEMKSSGVQSLAEDSPEVLQTNTS